MTISIDIGKFKAEVEHDFLLAKRSREVEFEVTWVSCGVYQMSYHRPRESRETHVGALVRKDWYPPNISISFTPEEIEKVAELFPLAPKNKRDECYKPFYENYTLDQGMFDFGHDTLFQAFKDPHENMEKVYMVNRGFAKGSPTASTDVLGLMWEDFQRLKSLIDSKKDEIFYSGVKSLVVGFNQDI